MTVLLLAGTRVVAAANIELLHIFPGHALDVAFEAVCGLADGVLTGSSESSRNVVLGERGQPGLFAGLIQELLDVVPIVPIHHVELVGLEKLFGNREDVFPR